MRKKFTCFLILAHKLEMEGKREGGRERERKEKGHILFQTRCVRLTLEGSSSQHCSITSATMHSVRSESDKNFGRKLPREMPVIIAGPSRSSYGIRPVHSSKSKIPNEYTSTDSFHTSFLLLAWACVGKCPAFLRT